MPDALPLTGLFGKVPAHGDFVRRGLPTSFVAPWDAWLQRGMEAARDRLGPRWAELWDNAPPWRFILPPGACGPNAVAGVMLPSQDMVGRRFPITLAALLAEDEPAPSPAWFATLEAAALTGRAGQADADALAAAIPAPGADLPEPRRLAPLTYPMDPPPLAMSGSDPLDLFSGDRPLAPTEFLAGTADRPGPDVAHLADSAPDAADPLDILAATAVGQASPASSDEDVLAIFAGAAPLGAAPVQAEPPMEGGADPAMDLPTYPSMATPAAPDPLASDGTLAFLLGEGAVAAPEPSPAPAPPDGIAPPPLSGSTDAVADQADPLAALIAAGEMPGRTLVVTDEEPAPAAAIVMETELAPPAAPTSDTSLSGEAPAAPPGGGWWTGGGGRLPPSIRPMPALLSAHEFASLLEADA